MTKLLEVNEERQLVRRHPAAANVEGWVVQAKELPRVLTYWGESSPIGAKATSLSAPAAVGCAGARSRSRRSADQWSRIRKTHVPRAKVTTASNINV